MSAQTPAVYLLTAARSKQRDVIAVVGTAKHVGKTSMIAALLDAAQHHAGNVGVLSLGRDGERRDAFDEREKPRFLLRAGMLAILSRSTLRAGLAVAWCESLRMPNALGELVVARALADVAVEITGPPSGTALAEAIDALRRHGAVEVFVDGALDRIAPLAAIDPAFIFATGMAAHADISRVAYQLAALTERLRLASPPDLHDTVSIEGVLDGERLREVFAHDDARDLLIDDPLRITHDAYLIARRVRRIWSRKRYAVIGCSVNAYAPSRSCDPQRLALAVAQATRLPHGRLRCGYGVDACMKWKPGSNNALRR